MSRTMRTIAILLLLAAAPLAAAEGDREGAPPQGEEQKTWTNEDLRELKGKGVSVVGGDVGSSAPPPPATVSRGEHWWRTQYTLMESRLKVNEAQLARQKDLLARASNPYTRAMARDERGKIADVTAVKQRIEELEKGIAATRKAMTDLDTAARKAGVPRDWRQPYGEGERAIRRNDPTEAAGSAPAPEGDAEENAQP